MKLVVLTPLVPFPLEEGGKISQFAFLEYLQNVIDIHLILIVKSQEEETNAILLSKVLTRTEIHIIKDIPITEGASSTVLKFCISIYRILKAFSKGSNKEKKANISALNDFDHQINFCNTFNSKIGNEVTAILDKISPDLIQVEHNPFLNIVDFLQGYKTIFVEHEIQFARLLSFKSAFLTRFEQFKITLNKTVEIAFLRKYTSVFVFSDHDNLLLRNEGLENQVLTSPFPIIDDAFKPNVDQAFRIEKLVFIGGSSHYPNRDAIEWYLDNVADEVYRLTNLKLHVIGKCESDLVKMYQGDAKVVFEGYVEDLHSFCANSLMVVPLRMGSGIRTKILYGMAQQLPVVSTRIGAEGINVTSGENILLADEIKDFIEAIVRLHSDINFGKEMAKNAYHFVYNNYSQSILAERRLNFYHEILNKV